METPKTSTSSDQPTQVEPAVVSTGWLAASMFDRPVERPIGRAFGVSLAVHGVLLALLIWGGMKSAEILTQPPEPMRVVFLEQPPGPGGGGGGNPAPAPPKPVEIPKPKVVPVPLTPPPVEVPPLPPVPTLTAPVMTNAQLLQASGQGPVSLNAPLGGGGRGTGLGTGNGRGVGPGQDAGFGGGAYRGGGIVAIRSVDPTYTSEAMRAKIQGTVELEVEVLENGTVGAVRITRSLDKTYGLDEKAIAAAKQWLFKAPMNQQGKPQRAIVTLILDFRLY